MIRKKLAMLAAGSAAALALGGVAAAPAHADDVSVQAVSTGTAFNGLQQQPLAATDVCAPILLIGGATDAIVDGPDRIQFFSGANCNGTSVIVSANSTLTSLGSPRQSFRAVT